MGQEDHIAAVLHVNGIDHAAVKGVSQLLVLQLRLSQGGEQPVLVAVHDLLCGKGDVNQVLPQRPGQGLFQQLQVFFRLLLAEQAHRLVYGGNDLPAAVDVAAVNMADAAPVQPDAAAYFIQFSLIHGKAPICPGQAGGSTTLCHKPGKNSTRFGGKAEAGVDHSKIILQPGRAKRRRSICSGLMLFPLRFSSFSPVIVTKTSTELSLLPEISSVSR